MAQRVAGDLMDGVASSHPLSVNYGMSVEYAVKLGRYDWINPNITSTNFPTTRNGTADIVVEIIHFNRYISTGHVLNNIDRMRYRPAELHELLAFGEKYPDVQVEFPVVALGSVWQVRNGQDRVPFLGLGEDSSGRGLLLMWLAGDWSPIYRFAAVRK